MAVQPPDEAGHVDGEEVERQLARILSSPDFVNASRLAAFLQYIMAKTLTGKAEQIKEYTIGIEVFDKPESFDPRLDTLVRVQASKLRGRTRSISTCPVGPTYPSSRARKQGKQLLRSEHTWRWLASG